MRQAEGVDGFLVAVNFGQPSAMVNFVDNCTAGVHVPEKVMVIILTGIGVAKRLKSAWGVIFTRKPETIVE